MKRLVLVGGGHAHLFVLRALAQLAQSPQSPRLPVAIDLICPQDAQYYSGMIPGWVSGHYPLNACQISLAPLLAAAGVHWLATAVSGLDAAKRELFLADGRTVSYDWVSFATGSETRVSGLHALGERLLPIKPIERFVRRWQALQSTSSTPGFSSDDPIVVVGGGAAGVEMAFALQRALQLARSKATVSLVSGASGVLPSHHRSVQQRVLAHAAHAGLRVYPQRAQADAAGLWLDDGRRLPAGLVLAATGACPPAWLQGSGLALDRAGYLRVDACHRSCSHPEVFAAGDVCARDDVVLARSGVHAVRAGPVLAGNLLAAVSGGVLHPYLPHARSLYLLSCGGRYAIASWGKYSAAGAWVWYLKDHIDRRFIRRFTDTG